MLEKEGQFERNWREAFEDQEMEISPSVWERIDRNLVGGIASKYQKQAVIYKWAAIVAILIAASVSIPFGVFEDQPSTSLAAGFSADEPTNYSELFISNLFSDELEKKLIEAGGDISNPSESMALGFESKGVLVQESVSKKELIQLAVLGDRKDIELVQNSPRVAFDVEPVPMGGTIISTRSPRGGKYWAGVGAGSSSFDPNYNLQSTNDFSDAVLAANPQVLGQNPGEIIKMDENMNDGVNYRVGLNLGMKIKDRWTLEGGMQYAQTQLTSTTNVLLGNLFSSAVVPLSSEVSGKGEVQNLAKGQALLQYSEQHVVLDNTFQYAAVPLKAGFIVLDKKLSMRINAGLMTNFYLGNTLADPDGDLNKVQLNPGQDSPYRTVTFSGMAGVSFGYQVLKNVDLLVEPNYAQSLAPITKTSSNFNTTPNRVGFTAGVRYNFK